MHRRHRTYTVSIVGLRDGAQTGNGSPCTLLQDGAPTLARVERYLYSKIYLQIISYSRSPDTHKNSGSHVDPSDVHLTIIID